MCRHSRDRLFGTRPWVMIPGKVPGSFWRVPTDLKTWAEFQRFGIAPNPDGVGTRDVSAFEVP